jgi:hypothetical protein
MDLLVVCNTPASLDGPAKRLLAVGLAANLPWRQLAAREPLKKNRLRGRTAAFQGAPDEEALLHQRTQL